jgi:hypothetical protein
MSYCRKGPDSDVYVYNAKDYDKDRRKVVDGSFARIVP